MTKCPKCGSEMELKAFVSVLLGGPGDEYCCPKCLSVWEFRPGHEEKVGGGRGRAENVEARE